MGNSGVRQDREKIKNLILILFLARQPTKYAPFMSVPKHVYRPTFFKMKATILRPSDDIAKIYVVDPFAGRN